MENIERDQALALMNVESSSQIFPIKEKPIRLFGKEFGGGGGDSASTMAIANMSESIDSNPFHDEPMNKYVKDIEASSRKYECHYCFRSFPTSQALGGHQNAHKKERQNAKRVQLQSPVVHENGINNYHHHLGETAAAATTRSQHHHSTWTNINNNSTPPRFYGNGHHVDVISPLAFWKIPPPLHHNNSSSSYSNLLFSNDDLIRSTSPVLVQTSTNCETNFVYEPKGDQVQDHVSLDLHL